MRFKVIDHGLDRMYNYREQPTPNNNSKNNKNCQIEESSNIEMGRSDGSIRIVSPYSRPTVTFVSSLSLKHDTAIEVVWIYEPRSRARNSNCRLSMNMANHKHGSFYISFLIKQYQVNCYVRPCIDQSRSRSSCKRRPC